MRPRTGTAPLWDDEARPSYASLAGPAHVDVAVVGAGFTGLWAALHLAQQDPSLRIAVLEAEHVGFGASGRNGGWASALFPVAYDEVARNAGREAALALRAELEHTVDQVVAFCAAHDVPAAKGGTLALARDAGQLDRLRDVAAHDRAWGGASRMLTAEQTDERVRVTGTIAAALTPHCAALHPGRLVRALAREVVAAGVALHEHTRVTAIRPGGVDTPAGRVQADVVLRATEAWTSRLPGLRRAVAPVWSLMVATEPLPAAVWEQIGWEGRETPTDGRNLLIYAQRTADGRIALGGRGAPYHFGSRIRPAYDHDERVFAALRGTVRELFPAARDAAFTHAWGGPIAIPRDFHPSVGLDRATGLGWAGGYVGDGVAATHLAGRTLADLVQGRETVRTGLPWVGHRSRAWEPEPLRWLGVNTGRVLAAAADRRESATGRSSRLTPLVGALTGH